MRTILILIIIYYLKNKCIESYINLFNGWKEYRLGDCVMDNKRWKDNLEKNHYHYFPNSIASKYMKNTQLLKNLDLLFKIVKTYENTTPDDSIIIHLRVGDVLENPLWSRHLEYPTKISKFKILINKLNDDKNSLRKIVLVGGSHQNYKEYKNSEKYINSVKKIFKDNGFDVKLRFGNNPDDDFIYMSNAKHFVRSGTAGNFTYLIAEMVKRNKGIVYKL